MNAATRRFRVCRNTWRLFTLVDRLHDLLKRAEDDSNTNHNEYNDDELFGAQHDDCAWLQAMSARIQPDESLRTACQQLLASYNSDDGDDSNKNDDNDDDMGRMSGECGFESSDAMVARVFDMAALLLAHSQ